MRKLLSLAIATTLVGVAIPASAQFSLSGSNVASAAAIGDAGNGTFAGTYGGPSTIFTSLNVTGSLTSVISGTWGEDSVFDFTKDGNGNFFQFRPELAQGAYTNIAVNRTVSVMAWFNSGDATTVEAFESFDDGAGTDANWDNVTATFDGSVSSMSLGTLASNVTFDTFASDFDTELAVYSADGTLIATNDDAGTGLQSELILSGLLAGNYYVLVGGFNSGFGNEFAIAGFGGTSDSGNVNLAVNGVSTGAFNFAPDTLKVYDFNVVPEPTTIGILAIGAIAALRRRKK